MGAIKINKLVKKYNSFTLDINNLEIKKGYITGFIGKNGAGKTTTIKSILGLINPEEKDIEVLGEDISENPYIKEEIGYVGNVSGLLDESTLKIVKSSLRQFYKKWDDERYNDYISKFEIDENQKYSQLSLGQRKQFELILALSHHPQLLIMDEPTANLDPIARNQIIDIITEIMESEEMTVFFSTHITSDLDKCSDYIVFIDNGKIVLQGEKDQICEEHVKVKGGKDIIDRELESEFVKVKCSQYGFEGIVNGRQKAFEMFGEEGIYEKCSLEDLMFAYIKKGGEIYE